ncbi:MAG: hypothetical protein JW901_05305 [Dehalococcoidia bacterium]|nr:hypothetical protein [Dehalococcoidia bacterium]
MLDVKPTLQTLVKRAETEFFPWVIESVVIEDDSQLKNMSDLLGLGKFFNNALEDARKAEKQPFLDGGKAVDDKFKPVQNRVQLAVSRLDSAVLTYHRKKKAEADALLRMQAEEQEAKRKAAEDAQIKEMLANAARQAECQETGEVFEPAPITPMPEPEELIVRPVGGTVRGNMSSTAIIEGYEYEIIDPDAVPRELCSPDLKKIKAKHKYDKLPVPGVLITPKAHTSTRLG